MSGAGFPSQSVTESTSCIRYSDMCERSLISGADSANCFRTVQVSSSRQTPTTDKGSLDEKLSRGGLLSASLMDIGFISHSEEADFRCYRALAPASLPAYFYQKPGRSR